MVPAPARITASVPSYSLQMASNASITAILTPALATFPLKKAAASGSHNAHWGTTRSFSLLLKGAVLVGHRLQIQEPSCLLCTVPGSVPSCSSPRSFAGAFSFRSSLPAIPASLFILLAPLFCMKGVSASSSLTAWFTLPRAAIHKYRQGVGDTITEFLLSCGTIISHFIQIFCRNGLSASSSLTAMATLPTAANADTMVCQGPAGALECCGVVSK